jgi:hypothetical protein
VSDTPPSNPNMFHCCGVFASGATPIAKIPAVKRRTVRISTLRRADPNDVKIEVVHLVTCRKPSTEGEDSGQAT